MGVIGHDAVVAALAAEFPQVALLTGPPSVGKWFAAEQVRRSREVHEPDVLRARRLDMAAVRSVVEFSSTAPATPAGRVAIVSLDSAAPAALNVLLKPLEEAGDQMHFMLVSSSPVPLTISSRARQYSFGLLRVEDVARILISQRGIAPPLAQRLAEQSGGQVRRALSSLTMAEDKALVLACVRHLREGDAAALEGLADRWRDEHTTLLAQWAREAVSGRWRLFNVEETGEVGSLPLRTLLALRRDVRSRLVIRSVLRDLVG